MTRALHPGTPEEEARTSAMLAVKLIAANKLLDQRPAPAPQRQAEEKVIRIQSRYGGFCKKCRKPYEFEDWIAWQPGTPGAMHWECYRPR